MSRKALLSIISAAVITIGGVVAFIPGAGPAIGGVIVSGGRIIESVGVALPDDCPRSVCACDAKGDCAIHGPIGFVDGGNSCRCP